MLVAENVSKTYGTYPALSDVSLSFLGGTIVGLLGPNGAGKTTLIRILNQITFPDSGRVLLKGKPLTMEDTRHFGYLPEERGLYKKMTVKDHLVFLGRLKGLTKNDALQRITQYAERLEFAAYIDKKVQELSKGMGQKVQFAGAVLHEPEILILDEPFSGFDPLNAEILKDEIIRSKQSGRVIMLSTHRMESVEELCDSIALINKGKLLFDGPVGKAKAQFKENTYSVRYKGSLPLLPDGVEVISSHDFEGETETIVKLNNGMKANDLLTVFLPTAEIVSFAEILPTMQEVFIKVVAGN